MQLARITTTSQFLLVISFCIFICIPPAIMFSTKSERWSEFEKRALAITPEFPKKISEVKSTFSSIDEYLKDHFGLRSFFLGRYQREIEKRFDKSSINQRVIKGLDDWYFFNDFGLLKDYLGLTPLDDFQINQFITNQQKKFEWLKAHNIHFLYAIAPNKQSIYPQFLMENSLKLKGTTRFEQLLSKLDGKFPEYMLNLHQLLNPENFDDPLYYKNDSHWNKLAAYVVFREVMEKITSWFPQEKFKLDFEFMEPEEGIGGNTGQGGDLVRILRQPNLMESFPQIKPFKRCGDRAFHLPDNLTNIPNLKGRPSFSRRCHSRNLRAIIFRDSFFAPLEPLFSENFHEILYLWKGYDQKNIEEILESYKPDIVIEMVVERHAFDPLTSPIVNQHMP